jgi:hypothetical protein
MTCQECQPLAIELARDVPPSGVGGAVQRADVLSHVATCKRCAQWLQEQEVLSDALRATAEADASLAAPPRVEANVMAAFRARQAKQVVVGSARPVLLAHATPVAHVAPVAQTNTPPPLWRASGRASGRGLWRASRPAWPAGRAAAFAAAATIVIVALTMASVRWLSPAAPVNVGTHNAAGTSTSPPAPSPSAPSPSEPSPLASSPPGAGQSGGRAGEAAGARVSGTNAAVIEVLPEKGKKGRPTPPGTTPPRAAASRVTTSQVAAGRSLDTHHTTRASRVARRANEFSGPAFVLLPYVEPLRPTEMRHIMRVRMPAAQLAAQGLQAESVDDAVLADVLVGEDGTARAVRIVQ